MSNQNTPPRNKTNLILPDHLKQTQDNETDPVERLIKVAQYLKQNRPEVFGQILNNLKK